MTCKLLFFDYRKSEEKFFNDHKFENYNIKLFRESLNIETLKQLSKEDLDSAVIISVFITSEVNEEVISHFKNLRVISTRSTGYNHICVNSCANKNIALLNVDAYGHTAVAQFAFSLLLALVRNIYPSSSLLLDENFHYEDLEGHDLNSLTLGVVGTGAIGMSVCRYAKCFGMNVLAYDVKQNPELVNTDIGTYTTLANLLKLSDVVSLHLPYTNENYHMFSDAQFEEMKDNSYLINVSRGELIDTKALLKYAKLGKFRGIGLDVVACPVSDNGKDEEKSSIFCVNDSETVKELNSLKNVIITPHIAYATQEAIDYILQATFEGISDYLSGGFRNRVL